MYNAEFPVGLDLGPRGLGASYFWNGKLEDRKFLKYTGLPVSYYAGWNDSGCRMECREGEGFSGSGYLAETDLLENLETAQEWLAARLRGKTVTLFRPLTGNGEIGAVLTVPPWCAYVRLNELRKAAETSGFRLLRFASDPEAAVVGSAPGQFQPERKILVLILEDIYFQISLLETEKWPEFRVIGQTQALKGGFYACFLNWVLKLVGEDNGFDLSSPQNSRMQEKEYTEIMTKIWIGLWEGFQTGVIKIRSLLPGYDLDVAISDEEIRDMVSPFLKRLPLLVSDFLAQNCTEPAAINRLVLIGRKKATVVIEEALDGIFRSDLVIQRGGRELLSRGAALIAKACVDNGTDFISV